MASIDEIINRVQAAGQKVNEGVQLLSTAENAANRLQDQMAGAGVQDKAAQFAQVKECIQRTRQQLLGGQELANQCIALARQAGG